jgi:hypothetical protein
MRPVPACFVFVRLTRLDDDVALLARVAVDDDFLTDADDADGADDADVVDDAVVDDADVVAEREREEGAVRVRDDAAAAAAAARGFRGERVTGSSSSKPLSSSADELLPIGATSGGPCGSSLMLFGSMSSRRPR